MAKSGFLVILILFLASASIAQLTAKGAILQNDTTQVEFCNLLILNPADSSFLSGEIVQNGYFDLKINQPEVLLKITAVGFEETFIYVNKSVDLGKIILTESTLSAIEITASKLPFEVQNGNIKINTANNIFQSSSSPQEILNKSPGVVVSSGEVNVIGSGQAIIYLDKTQISFAAMQAIPVSQIESIEIIKNPDASYDAEGKAIILIILKDLGLEGVQGTLTGHYTKAFYHLGFVDLNINAQKGKWSLNASANSNNGATGTRSNSDFDVNTNTPYTAHSSYKEKVYLPMVTNYLIGTQYKINANHSVSLQYSGNYSDYDLEIESSIDQTIENSLIQIATKDTAKSIEQTNAFSANYSFVLDSLGSNLFAGVTYSTVFVSYADTIQETYAFNSEVETLNSVSSGKNKNDIATLQLDFQKVFKNQNQLKIGAKGANASSNSSVFLQTFGDSSMVNSRDDAFKYDERILSVYSNWKGQWKLGDYQLGLRTEHTTSLAQKSQNTAAYIDTSYLSFFPNAGITTKFKNWSMSDQVTSKISRPRYSDITPYIYYINSFSSVYGNPFVKPSFVYNFEHKFIYKETSFGLGSNFTKGPRTYVNLQDTLAESINVLKVVNVDQLQEYYVEIRKSTSFSSVFNYTMVNLSYATFQSDVYDFGNLKTTPKIYAYTYNQIGIKKWFDFELIGEFTSGFSNGNRKVKAQGELGVGISKTFASGKCFAQITVSDIFQTAKYSPSTSVNGNSYSSTSTYDTRFVRIFFSYKFGKLKMPDYNHLNMNENEIQRAK